MTRILNNRPHPEKSPPPQPRQRLKPVGAKRRVLNALCQPTREQFREDFPRCMICATASAVDVHEIVRGAARQHVLANPRLLLSVCRKCHESLDETALWTVARQIAVRIRWEIRRTVREANSARGRAQSDTTAAEVVKALRRQTK